MQLVTRSNFAALAFILALALNTSAQTTLSVYDDGEQNGFQDWTWVPHNLINTSPVHSGAYSISVSPTNSWSGLYLHHVEFDTSPYVSLSFWVNGGTNGGQRLQVQAHLGKDNPPADVYYRFTVMPGAWQQITVPLTSLGAADQTNCTGFWIQMTSGSPKDTFFVDDIRFDPKAVATITSPNTNTAVAIAPAEQTSRAAGVNWNVIGWCIAGALIVITALLGWLVVMLRRSGLGTAKALMPSPSALPQINPRPPVGVLLETKPPLIGSETSTDPQTQALRERMASELTEFAKQSLVQGLYSQRSNLLEAQKKAQQELAELEARLASLHLPLQERIRAYETRIGELEKALETRDEEMREMIRATLLLIRERLEKEKAGGFETPRFN